MKRHKPPQEETETEEAAASTTDDQKKHQKAPLLSYEEEEPLPSPKEIELSDESLLDGGGADAADFVGGPLSYLGEIFPAQTMTRDEALFIKTRLSPAGTQTFGSDLYERVLADAILDFQSDGQVLVVGATAVSGLISADSDITGESLERLLAVKRLKDPRATRLDEYQYVRSWFGVKRSIPVRDPSAAEAILRQIVCENGSRITGLIPSDFPIQSRALPFPYRAIVFLVPSTYPGYENPPVKHFSAVIYYTHQGDSEELERGAVHAQYSTGRRAADAEARLYVYDSASNLNRTPNETVCRVLATRARLFNSTGAYRMVQVFGARAAQVDNSCSSWSVYFGERVRQACLAVRYEPLLMDDFLPPRSAYEGQEARTRELNDSVCAVDLLRMMIERIDNGTRWWGETAEPERLRALVGDFVRRRVRFEGGTQDAGRSARLVDALVRFFAHELPTARRQVSYKAPFVAGDGANVEVFNPDMVRLYLLMALVVPNGVVFSTSIDSVAERWNKSVERYKSIVESIRANPNLQLNNLYKHLPRLVMWLYLPPEDAASSSAVPNALKLPVLFVCRPTYSSGFTQAFARLSHINIYTANQLSVDIADEISVELLTNVFYAKLENYAERPEEAQAPDDVSFSPLYNFWSYSVIDVARHLAQHDGYFDYNILGAPELAASWSRPVRESIPGVSTQHIELARGRIMHRMAREHFRGKLLQLLVAELLPEDSANKTTLLFNTRSTLGTVDIDSTSWRNHEVRPRVSVPARIAASEVSLLRPCWAFFYYNLSFSAVVIAAMNQTDNAAVPCAVWLEAATATVLDSWTSVIKRPRELAPNPAQPALLKVPVLIHGPRVGAESTQPVCFSVFDILWLLKRGPEFAAFFAAHNRPSYQINREFHEAYRVGSTLITASQDPYARVVLLGYNDDRRRRIAAFIDGIRLRDQAFDEADVPALIADYNYEEFARVAYIAAVFIIAKTHTP